jgi:hypothetical protein
MQEIRGLNHGLRPMQVTFENEKSNLRISTPILFILSMPVNYVENV